MTPERIKQHRLNLGDSRAEFADRIGVRERTVRSWENREAIPNGPSRKLLTMLDLACESVDESVDAE